MRIHKYFILNLAIILISISCEDRSDLTQPSAANTGSADFSKFVSIGNSLTAGYQSGALFESGQKYSYGKLIADQVGTNYAQPTIDDPGIGGRIEVKTLEPFTTSTQPAAGGLPNNSTYENSYNNLGIPGIVVADVLTTTASPSNYVGNNLLIDVVLRGQGTVISQALALQPTFMTVWIGNNDILGYATSGGTLPYTPIDGDINFGVLYSQLLGAIAQAGVQNVLVANIPDVSSIPFFTTVGGQLRLQGITQIVGTKSDGTIAPLDLTKNLLTLRASEELAQGKGMTADNPLSNSVILDEGEIAIAKSIISSFNSTILAVSSQFGFHLVDMHSFFNSVAQNGLTVDGVTYTTQFLTGGLFSLDGVHPTSQGYAIIANEFIKVVNSKYNADIPLVNVSSIPGSIELAKKVNFNKLGLPIFDEGTFDSIFY